MEKKAAPLKIAIGVDDSGEVIKGEVDSELTLQNFAVHHKLSQKDVKGYSVSHLASGRYVFASVPFRTVAFKLCRQLQILHNLGILTDAFIKEPDENFINWLKSVSKALLHAGKARDLNVSDIFNAYFQEKIIAAQGIQMELFGD